MLKATALASAGLAGVLTATAVADWASGEVKFSRGSDAKMMQVKRALLPFTPAAIHDAGLVTIFNSLASRYPKGEYWCCSGYNVMGPNQGTLWMGAAFTPDADHTVTKLEIAVGWSDGTNGVDISLNSDSNGMPGKALKTWSVTGLSRFGTCCSLVTVSDKRGIPISGGKQYWVVLKTNDNETDTVDAWNIEDADQVDQATLASYDGTQWHVFQTSPGVGFAVKGIN